MTIHVILADKQDITKAGLKYICSQILVLLKFGMTPLQLLLGELSLIL